MMLPRMPRLPICSGRAKSTAMLLMCGLMIGCAVPTLPVAPPKTVTATEAALCRAWGESIPAKPTRSRADTPQTQAEVGRVRGDIDVAVNIHAAACDGPQ